MSVHAAYAGMAGALKVYYAKNTGYRERVVRPGSLYPVFLFLLHIRSVKEERASKQPQDDTRISSGADNLRQ